MPDFTEGCTAGCNPGISLERAKLPNLRATARVAGLQLLSSEGLWLIPAGHGGVFGCPTAPSSGRSVFCREEPLSRSEQSITPGTRAPCFEKALPAAGLPPARGTRGLNPPRDHILLESAYFSGFTFLKKSQQDLGNCHLLND